METLQINNDWTRTSSKVFWGEIAPCEHVVQVYENDTVFLDLLNGFVSDGLQTGECVIVIATKEHVRLLNHKLQEAGFNLANLRFANQYIAIDAEELLGKFMVNDWPDENLFMHEVSTLIAGAKKDDRQVRAFGEMVAILWAKGQVGATVRLEQLWNKFCATEAFCLFCAYPQTGFTQDASESLIHICGAHSKMIAGDGSGKNELFYKIVDQKQVE